MAPEGTPSITASVERRTPSRRPNGGRSPTSENDRHQANDSSRLTTKFGSSSSGRRQPSEPSEAEHAGQVRRAQDVGAERDGEQRGHDPGEMAKGALRHAALSLAAAAGETGGGRLPVHSRCSEGGTMARAFDGATEARAAGRRGARGGAGRRAARASRAEAPAGAARGRLKQSVSRWCFGKMSLDELCAPRGPIGYRGIDLLGPGRLGHGAKHGLACPLGMLGAPATIDQGPQPRREPRRDPRGSYAAGSTSRPRRRSPNVICFSGNRAGHADDEGHRELRRGPEADRRRSRSRRSVTLCHGAAQQQGRPQGLPCATTRPGASSWCKQVGSPRVQAALRHLPHADHGGRRDPHDPARTRRTSATTTPAACRAGTRSTTPRSSTTRPSCRAIVDTGYKGFVGQEFIPTRDPLRVAGAGVSHLRRVRDNPSVQP